MSVPISRLAHGGAVLYLATNIALKSRRQGSADSTARICRSEGYKWGCCHHDAGKVFGGNLCFWVSMDSRGEKGKKGVPSIAIVKA